MKSPPVDGVTVDFDALLNGNVHTPAQLVPAKAAPASDVEFVDLPAAVQFPADMAAEAAPWLDDYVAHSREWSPRAYDDFHEACGLWVLSTVAARRVTIDLGKRRYPNLYIALAARTSIYAKSTTAGIGQAILHAAGLDYLLAPDDSTPQAFVKNLTATLPTDWERLSPEKRALITNRIAFSGQRGWFFDEFGQKVSAMMRDGGHMADFRALLRKFDDSPDVYEYVSISRGTDLVRRPYLALLANLTPADLAPYAKRGSALWNDGFWARFAFVTPPLQQARGKGKFPAFAKTVPDALVGKLRRWHERLGVPTVEVEEIVGDKGTRYELRPGPLREQRVQFGDGVFDAWYRYNDALVDLVERTNYYDLDGNYTRLAEKALRIGMLIASLENDGVIEMAHWARAQAIAETWRRNLHNLYDQVVGESITATKMETLEDKIMQTIAERGPLTQRELYTYIRGLDVATASRLLEGMVAGGLLNATAQGKRTVFSLVAEA